MGDTCCGWTGKILHIDLATGERDVLRPEPEFYAAWLGGRGLAGRFLGRCAGSAADSPDQPLVLAAGPLGGTNACGASLPGANLCRVAGPSPLAGAVCDGDARGRLGLELKNAGWDAVVLVGRSPRPCGVEIADDAARLTDASGLAGLDTAEIHARLRAALPGCATLVAGPAGNSDCLLAALVADGRSSVGRGGLGWTAGRKNLVSIAVRGTGGIRIADPEGLRRAGEDILRLVSAAPALTGEHGLAAFGTACLADLTDARGMTPTANFRRTRFADSAQRNAWALAERFRPRAFGCPGCPAPCGRMDAAGRPLPEFSALSHFTALLENRDLELAVRASDLCLRLGLDPVGAAAAIACRSEITGTPPAGERLLALLRDMAAGRGAGAEPAKGSARLAAHDGRPELSMSVKGLDLPAFDPRGAYGAALSMAVAANGGDVGRAWAIFHEILRKPVATDRFSFEGKARIVKNAEDAYAAADSLVACPYFFVAASLTEFARAFGAATGLSVTPRDLAAAGERIVYRERMMNARRGLSAADDDLPPRFFAEGDGATPPIPREAFLAARAAYYRIRGLTPEGRPTAEKAAALGLDPPETPGSGGAK